MSSFMLDFLPIVTHTAVKRYWMIDPASVWLGEALFKMESCGETLNFNFRHFEKPCQHKPPTSAVVEAQSWHKVNKTEAHLLTDRHFSSLQDNH